MNAMGIRRTRAAVCLGYLCTVLANGCDDAAAAKSQPLAKVGAPCVQSHEAMPAFPGTAAEETNIELASPVCGGELRVSYHFRGRVGCPYGQTAEDIAALGATDPARCRVTNTAGSVTNEPVTVGVSPQLVDRPAAMSVYCSCQCSGSDPNREYCNCPTGMQCESIPSLGLPSTAVTSYCVRLDSLYVKTEVSTLECSRTSTDPATDCGNNRQNP
jgi:hypothetical protein